MFRIKICGITNIDDALVAADAGADAIGFNFFKKSRRFIEPEAALEITEKLPPGVMKVGVFVNPQASETTAIASRVGLDCIQLHGDEPPELLAALPRESPSHPCPPSRPTSVRAPALLFRRMPRGWDDLPTPYSSTRTPAQNSAAQAAPPIGNKSRPTARSSARSPSSSPAA